MNLRSWASRCIWRIRRRWRSEEDLHEHAFDQRRTVALTAVGVGDLHHHRHHAAAVVHGAAQAHGLAIPVMAGAVFLFLSVRTNPDKEKIVAQLLKTLNKPASGRPKPEGPDEPKEKAPPVYWGKTDKGDFRIITVRGAGQTSGAKCRDKKIVDIKKILQEEGFSSEEIDRHMEPREEESQLSLKQKMCQLLENHLKEQNRYR